MVSFQISECAHLGMLVKNLPSYPLKHMGNLNCPACSFPLCQVTLPSSPNDGHVDFASSSLGTNERQLGVLSEGHRGGPVHVARLGPACGQHRGARTWTLHEVAASEEAAGLIALESLKQESCHSTPAWGLAQPTWSGLRFKDECVTPSTTPGLLNDV